MQRALALSRQLEAFAVTVGRLAAWLAIPMMIIIVADVILRRYFVIGSTILQELEWHLHGALFLLCLGYAYAKGAHVRIELLHDRFSLRTKAWIELLGCLFFLIPFCIAVIKFGTDFALMSFEAAEISASQVGLAYRWVIKSVLVLGFVLLACAALSRLLRAIVFLFGPPSLAGRTGFSDETLESQVDEQRS